MKKIMRNTSASSKALYENIMNKVSRVVKNALNEKRTKVADVFFIDIWNEAEESSADDMQYAHNCYSYEEAYQLAKEAAASYDSEYVVRIFGGEWEDSEGSIWGEPDCIDEIPCGVFESRKRRMTRNHSISEAKSPRRSAKRLNESRIARKPMSSTKRLNESVRRLNRKSRML